MRLPSQCHWMPARNSPSPVLFHDSVTEGVISISTHQKSSKRISQRPMNRPAVSRNRSATNFSRRLSGFFELHSEQNPTEPSFFRDLERESRDIFPPILHPGQMRKRRLGAGICVTGVVVLSNPERAVGTANQGLWRGTGTRRPHFQLLQVQNLHVNVTRQRENDDAWLQQRGSQSTRSVTGTSGTAWLWGPHPIVSPAKSSGPSPQSRRR